MSAAADVVGVSTTVATVDAVCVDERAVLRLVDCTVAHASDNSAVDVVHGVWTSTPLVDDNAHRRVQPAQLSLFRVQCAV